MEQDNAEVTRARLQVREAASQLVTAVLHDYMMASGHPVLVLHELPTVLGGLAGSLHLQLVRSQAVGDGDAQRMLDEMVADMLAHANPDTNPPTGSEVSKPAGRRMRDWLKGVLRHG